jgi:hypothetical protein
MYSTTSGVVASQVGGFASRSTLNDAFHTDALALMQCCNAAGARGIYDLWRYAVETRQPDRSAPPHHLVHLRFSVATPDVRVTSYEPQTGRLDIMVDAACQVSVRLPGGEDHGFVTVAGAGDTQPYEAKVVMADKGYVRVRVGGACTVRVDYRLRDWSAEYTVGQRGRSITCVGHWRGETLMSVERPGPYLPLYGRSRELAPVEPLLGAGIAIESL